MAGVAVLLLLPVFAALAVAIRWDSPGPVLFRQRRVGRGGRPFDCLKLRTMRVGADREVVQLADQNEHRRRAVQDAPRPARHPGGPVLRRLSLDELPQLFNVLGGSMSLVGPRPPLPQEVDQVRRRRCGGGCSSSRA